MSVRQAMLSAIGLGKSFKPPLIGTWRRQMRTIPLLMTEGLPLQKEDCQVIRYAPMKAIGWYVLPTASGSACGVLAHLWAVLRKTPKKFITRRWMALLSPAGAPFVNL